LITKISDRNTPNFQIVILDEADSMTTDAQSALRRVIEDYTKNTRFCFICNYVSKIIDPIASRCAKYRFSPLTRDSQLARLKHIAHNEKLSINEGVMNFLIDISEGDLRRSINLLQSISQLGENLMTPQVINDVCGIIPVDELEILFNTSRTSNTEGIIKSADQFFYSGYDLRQLLVQMNEYITFNQSLSETEKIKIREIIQDSEISLLEGASPNLKLYCMLTEIRNVFSKK
jgi:replication factor C subunit 2/4